MSDYQVYGKDIQGIVSTGKQLLRLNTTNGEVRLTLTYRPAVQMWFCDIQTNEKNIMGIRLCLSLNLLNQWSNVIGFGLMLKGEGEPMFIDDFSTGRVVMTLLSKEEIEIINDFYSGR